MDSILLCHSNILRRGEFAHLVRAVLARTRPKALHYHDFFEILCVQNGQVRHYFDGGHNILTEGDLLFVRPEHQHGLQAASDEAMVVSITLHPDAITQMGAGFPMLGGHFFWGSEPLPVLHHRDSRALARLNHAALRLERADRSMLEVSAFLLPLCAELLDEAVIVPETAPEWLSLACAAMQQPANFRLGAAGFAHLSGKSTAYISRAVKQHLGQTPTEFVNDIRMTWAARKLAGTSDPLPEIAADCGLPNLSHFHRLFFAHHQMTPHQFRKQMQRNVVQPTDNI